MGAALLAALLEAPGNFYELFPIAVLIGTIYSMSRLAQSSEYTILRTGGLGPGRALWLLAALGIVFGIVTFVVGDYAAPLSERESALIKAQYKGQRTGRAGAWLKDRHPLGRRRPQRVGERAGAGGRRHPPRHPHLRVRRRRPPAAAHRRAQAAARAPMAPGC